MLSLRSDKLQSLKCMKEPNPLDSEKKLKEMEAFAYNTWRDNNAFNW